MTKIQALEFAEQFRRISKSGKRKNTRYRFCKNNIIKLIDIAVSENKDYINDKED